MENTTPEINVESYQKTASIGGWAGAGRTLWAISTVGIIAGAIIGLLAPLIPALLLSSVAMPSLLVIGKSVAIFAATGLSAGFGGGMMLGRISGSVASVAEESERRSKEWTIRQIKGMNPNAEIIPDAPKEEAPKKSLLDTYRTYINPRVGMVMTAIGIIGGLIMGAAFIASTGGIGAMIGSGTGLLATLTGVEAATLTTATGALTPIGTSLAMSYSAGIGAVFGGMWFFNFPQITSKVTEFYGNLISGKSLGREWGPPAQEKQQAISSPEAEACGCEHKRHASFRDLIASQSAQQGATLAKR